MIMVDRTKDVEAPYKHPVTLVMTQWIIKRARDTTLLTNSDTHIEVVTG